ncbi:MAG: transcriptional regulator [Caulobacteraceae bacterium]|nr:transcriptional regulator [Caulobacteraceae bacterium]
MRASDFEKLKVFAAVAERGSFVKAAARLGLSTSSVSQSVRTLEDRLGLRLLNRTTRSVALTEAGAYLLERVQRALEELDGAFEGLNTFRAEPAGLLKLSVSSLSLSMVVAPMVARFLAAHPAIQVEVAITDEADLDAAVHAGIRDKAAIPQDMVAIRVGEPSRFLAVASPAYIAANGRPERPADLARHNCILFRTRSGRLYPWAFLDGARTVEAQVSGSLVTDNGNFLLSAAVDGAGIGYVIETYARPHLEAGDLAPLLEDHAVPFQGFFLYYPSRRHMPLPLKLFAEFLTSTAEAPGRRASPRFAETPAEAPALLA